MYPTIIWTGCLTHGMNLAMKDFGRLEYNSTVLRQAQEAVNLIRKQWHCEWRQAMAL